MTTENNRLLVKISKKYHCEKCNYKTSRKYNMDLHINSMKHKNNQITTENNVYLVKTSKTHECINCNKLFNDRAGLWRHNKKCKHANDSDQNITNNNSECNKNDLMNYLIKENQEFKNLLLEIVKKDTYTTNNTISNNKSFNLNLFLNETCKDAMNIMDFVDSIKLQLSDLERVGELGFVDGISNIIVNSLKELDITERPIHCTDKKREVIYVKDADKWEKEDAEKKNIRKVIKKVANKNIMLLQKFKEVHPDCGKSASVFSDQYNKIIIESMGGSGDNDSEKEEKIIQKISKNVTINKELSN